jgi:hypothetical protein
VKGSEWKNMWEREYYDGQQLYSHDNGLYNMYTVLLVHYISINISAYYFTPSSPHTTANIKFMHEFDISVM